MSQQRIVLLGATSAVAQCVARQLAERDYHLTLVARDAQKLETVANDLQVRGAATDIICTDFDNLNLHADLCQQIENADSFWLFYGTLPDQAACESSWDATMQALNTNFVSAASLLTRIANSCEARKSGQIVVVSSVAGDRGRKSNYVYGTAKGALTLFCQGLRNRLSSSNVGLLTVKPGFIDTPMTKDQPKNPAVLWATPEKVAADIIRAVDRGSDVLYTPWFWRFIMLIIKTIPEKIFKRLSI